MGETDFPWTTVPSSSDNTDSACGVMDLSKRPREYERIVFREESCNRVYLRYVDDLRKVHVGEDGRECFSKHRFSGARRSLHEDIMSSGGCNDEGSFGVLLSDDVLESRRFRAGFIFFYVDFRVDWCVRRKGCISGKYGDK